MTGLWVLLGALVVSVAVGLVLRVRDGRFRTASTDAPGTLRPSAGRALALAPGLAAADADPAPRPGPAADPGPDPRARQPSDRPPDQPSGPPSEPPSASGQPVAPGAAATGRSIGIELSQLGRAAGERATLLQFSTSFCAPCRATRQVLADAARLVPGVVHVEVDAESHLDLVRRLGVRRTPTVLVLDRDAVEVQRASGAAPSRAAVLAALDRAVNGSAPSPAGRVASVDGPFGVVAGQSAGIAVREGPEHDSSDSSGDR